MDSTSTPGRDSTARNASLLTCFLAICCLAFSGCHDGPLYALKAANPYYAIKEWRADEKLGVTDHQRRKELQSLASQIGSMPQKDQLFWSKHLGRIIENDPSPEMRRVAILAAADLSVPGSIELIERGLGDESLKVQMEACRSLGKRPEPEAARLLASTVGSTEATDVKNSAIAALGNHEGNISRDSLRIVLDEQDPATLHLAMNSLRGVTGKDYGNDPQAWIAAIDQGVPDSNTGGDTEIRYAEAEGKTQRR
ncbi:MAG: HEAT repeat domain-containing protein [Planctomycetota bacterium]